MHALGFSASCAALIAAASASAAPLDLPHLLAKGCSERRAAFAEANRDERAALLSHLTDDQLVALAQRSLCELGPTYRVKLRKQERVRGALLDPQVMALTVREEPFAVLLDVIDGPAKGRRALYNAQARPAELRAREGGLLGVFPMWVDINGSLAMRDTNHVVTDLGTGGFLRRFEANFPRSRRAGVVRHDLGWDGQGRYCIDYVAPPGAKDVYAARNRLCLDASLALPVSSVSTDESGALTEDIQYSQFEANAQVPANLFTVEGAGL